MSKDDESREFESYRAHFLRRLFYMVEKAKNIDELLAQIDEFEKTIHGLAENVAKLKVKLVENKAKYGPDLATWPKEA